MPSAELSTVSITAPGSWQTLPKSVLNEWMMPIRKDAQEEVSNTFILQRPG